MEIGLNNILIADDQPIVRHGLEIILSTSLNHATFFHARTLAETIEILNKVNFDLLFLDLFFPDGNSICVINEIRKKFPDLRIIVFSGMEDNVYAPTVLRAGANAYINKSSSFEVLEKALNQVIEGKPCFSNELILFSGKENKDNLLKLLSERELEVVRMLYKGAGNLEICNSLNLQKSTVSTYVKRIKEKLNVEHVSQIIKIYDIYKHTISVK